MMSLAIDGSANVTAMGHLKHAVGPTNMTSKDLPIFLDSFVKEYPNQELGILLHHLNTQTMTQVDNG